MKIVDLIPILIALLFYLKVLLLNGDILRNAKPEITSLFQVFDGALL